jgi:hypothetical protein
MAKLRHTPALHGSLKPGDGPIIEVYAWTPTAGVEGTVRYDGEWEDVRRTLIFRN